MNTTEYFTYINAMFLFCIFTCGLLLAVGWKLTRKSDALKKEQDAHLKATNTNTLLNKALSAKNAGLQANECKLRDAEKEIRELQAKLDHAEADRIELRAERATLENQLAAAKRVRNAKGVFVRKDGTYTPKVKPLPTIADEVVESKENECGGNCGMNYCDENGCIDRKRELADSTPRKPHTLRHGMTVMNPTDKEAKEIFEAARVAGIECDNSKLNNCPWIWVYIEKGIGPLVTFCTTQHSKHRVFVTPSEFIARIKGEVG
jgi:hypothetical protein